jgi:alpha-beta hydrolase superfamily lysophospholipase
VPPIVRIALAILLLAYAVWSQASKLLGPTPDQSIALLSPSGPFAIGTKTYSWVDRSRHEKASHNPKEFRRLIVQVWYPARSQGGVTSPYVRRLSAYRTVWEKSEIHAASRTQTHSHLNATPAPDLRFPVVLLSHGWQGTRSEYSSLAEDLASRGYAVFGVDHPYMGRIVLPNGKVTPSTEQQFRSPGEIMEYYGRDLRFAIDEITRLNASSGDPTLAGRLDLSRIAAIGHSSGFSAVSDACRRDSRIQACVNIDAPGFTTALLSGLNQPLLWIWLERAGPVPSGFLAATRAEVDEVRIQGANHGSAEDWDYLEASSQQERGDAARRLTLIRNYVAAFLGKSLQDQDSPLLGHSLTEGVIFTRYPPH